MTDKEILSRAVRISQELIRRLTDRVMELESAPTARVIGSFLN